VYVNIAVMEYKKQKIVDSGVVVDYFTVDGIKEWQTIWLVFAAYAVVIAIIFAVSFNYKSDIEETKNVKLSA